MGAFHAGSTANAIPISLVSESGLGAWLNAQTASTRTWAAASGFRGERQKVLVVPGSQGDVACVALGVGNLASLATLSLWHTALLPDRLPSGVYAFAEPLEERPAGQAALGWAVGAYRFERYRKAAPRTETALVWPDRCDRGQVESAARAIAWARDLINTPTNDMSPAHLAAEAVHMAERFGATHELLVGEELLKRNYPAVHAVGRAAETPPRLIDIRWGRPGTPLVTLVGKGVCFDSGGLDVKPAAGMQLMKKDMGGAACVLATAQMIMESALPIRLRVLVPAVENSISGDAYRPGDILRTRKGLSVEVGNTDAEGRLILGDCLAEADASGSDLIIDLATLTGAARIALGPELPAAYSNDAALLDDFVKIAEAEHDPVWPMPLWPGYEDEFASKVADLNNVSSTSYAGSVIAALFLGRFVTACPRWLHVDLFAWNAKERPGRPVGAEAQCVRAVHALLTQRYGR
ncbi:MAG TPA: leucyl aminopeptidase family protein [Steroidobacteraceae bacterium]|nr:leucyl aminopeptidase family protein [Steroidobacteraceae bacterium]